MFTKQSFIGYGWLIIYQPNRAKQKTIHTVRYAKVRLSSPAIYEGSRIKGRSCMFYIFTVAFLLLLGSTVGSNPAG